MNLPQHRVAAAPQTATERVYRGIYAAVLERRLELGAWQPGVRGPIGMASWRRRWHGRQQLPAPRCGATWPSWSDR